MSGPAKNAASTIKKYEEMSAADIEAELRLAGIDPRPTVEAVTKLVHDKVEEWRRRGLHGEGRPVAPTRMAPVRAFRPPFFAAPPRRRTSLGTSA